jgi:signal transduction histidine kinase/putative methionine-R-sulfoxide reductase with GAF domain
MKITNTNLPIDGNGETVESLRKSLIQQEARTASILEISSALRATRSEVELLNLIIEKIALLMDAERCTLFLMDEQTNELWTKITQDQRTEEIRLVVGEGLAGWVAQSGQSVNIKDAYKDPRFNPEVDQRTGFITTSVLCQPMRNQDKKTLGVIQVLNKRHGYFTLDDELLLSAIAGQAAVVIENSVLYHSVLEANYELNEIQEILEQKVSEQDTLFEVQRNLNEAISIDDMVTTVATKTLALLPSEACVVTLADQGNRHTIHLFRELGTQTSLGTESLILRPLNETGPTLSVIRTGKPYLCNPPEICETDLSISALDIVYRSVVSVPLFAEDKAFGSIELINKLGISADGGHEKFSTTDLRFLTVLAGQVAPAMGTNLFRVRKEKDDRLASIGQMLSGVLHDLKTPMTIISGYVQLMSGQSKAEQRNHYSELISRQFDHLQQMTQEILAFAKGDSTILLRKVLCTQFMTELGELLAPEFDELNIDITLNTRYRKNARFDAGKLKRALLNLARNARDAMPDGGQITVTLDAVKDTLIFRISDTGPGIPEEIQDLLFESFFTHGKRSGTGLGLAIVKKIVNEHGGTIEFTTCEKGTTFEIKLPLDKP